MTNTPSTPRERYLALLDDSRKGSLRGERFACWCMYDGPQWEGSPRCAHCGGLLPEAIAETQPEAPECAACERPQDASAAEPCTCIELAPEDAAEEMLAAERFAAEAAATQAQAFSAALDAFKRAAGDLAAAWQAPAIGGDAVADYPRWMPSFDEAALDIAGMAVQR